MGEWHGSLTRSWNDIDPVRMRNEAAHLVYYLIRTLNRNVNTADGSRTVMEGANGDPVVTIHVVLLHNVPLPSTRTGPAKSADEGGSFVQVDAPRRSTVTVTRTARNNLEHAGVDLAVVDRAEVVFPAWIVIEEHAPVFRWCSVSDSDSEGASESLTNGAQGFGRRWSRFPARS